MIRVLSLGELLRLYLGVMGAAGDSPGIHDLGAIQTNAARPRAHWGAHEMFPTLARKAAALCCGLATAGGVSVGRLRFAHAALETLLVLNGVEITAPADEQEHVMQAVAARRMEEAELATWVESHSAKTRRILVQAEDSDPG